MPEAIATPTVVGSDVRDVAALIEQKGLLEQSIPVGGPPEEQAPEEAPATPEPEETPEGEPAPESEGEQPEEVESTTREAEPEPQEELPDTLDGIAEAVGLSADEFADHLNVPIKVNGEIRMVTLKEAQRGYQLEVDYTRKTEILAEERRAHESNVQTAVQSWQQQFAGINALAEQLQNAVTEDTGNLDRILTEEGFEAHYAAKLRVDQKKELMDHAKVEREKAALEVSQQQELRVQEFHAQQRNLMVQIIPDLGSETKGPKIRERMTSYLRHKGATEAHLANINEALFVDVIHDAMRFYELQKAKSSTVKKLKDLPKVVKPGAAPEKGDVARSRGAAALQRLKKSGTREDAAKLIEGIL